jgi:hypothetical protein
LRAVSDVPRTRGGVCPRVPPSRIHRAGAEIRVGSIGHVALNVLTNFFNKAAGVDVDFPLVEA